MKKNVSGQVVYAQLVSATDGSAFTSTVAVTVTGDSGSQAAGTANSGNATHKGNGIHAYSPSQAETNFDQVVFGFTGTGAVPVARHFETSFPQTGDGFARLGAPAGASVSADIAAVKAVDDAVKAKTDNLPASPASTGDVTTATASLATSSAVATIQSDTNDIQTRLPSSLTSAGRMKSDMLAINGAAMTGDGTTGDPWGAA